MKTRSVRGTQDKLNVRLEKKLENIFTKKMLTFSFTEIRTPVLEHLDLFVKCIGQNTDVVGKEMFLIQADDEDKICLRPEATASTVRAFLDSGIQATSWKVFSCGPMFRHERPQKGRWRQFDQFNIEIIDSSDIYHDILLIELLDGTFKRDLSMQDYMLHINYLGKKDERAAHRVAMVEFLKGVSVKLCKNCIERTETNPLRCFDCKNEQCRNVMDSAPNLERFFGQGSSDEWLKVQESLEMMSVNFVKDSRLVRGLDYYNGVVFEFKSTLLGAQDTFCGGGRYDLSEPFELKKQLPSVGAAVGIGRLQLLLEEAGIAPELEEEKLCLILPLSSDQNFLALMLLRELTSAGICADALFENCSVSNLLKKANKTGAKKVLLIGQDEQAQNCVLVKDMLTGEQKKVSQADLVTSLLT